MKILGIDPGSTSMGYAVLDDNAGALSAIDYGTTAIKAASLSGKLLLLSNFLEELLRKHNPDAAGVEKLFLARNKKTAFEVAHARGVILLTLAKNGIDPLEVTPNEVKVAVTNYGGADKQMVAKMVAHILKLPKIKGDDNAADALAIAIAAANLSRTNSRVINN